jgi:hypothetical protein
MRIDALSMIRRDGKAARKHRTGSMTGRKSLERNHSDLIVVGYPHSATALAVSL